MKLNISNREWDVSFGSFSRFIIKDNSLYRKKFDSDGATEIHQLVVSASQV